MSDTLDQRARELAPKCEIILDLARALRVDFQVANHLNEKLKLGLTVQRADRKPSDWERKPLPKPTSKAKGAK